MGLGYVLFKGTCEFMKQIEENPNYKFGMMGKEMFNERQTVRSKPQEIFIEPDSEMVVPELPVNGSVQMHYSNVQHIPATQTILENQLVFTQ